MTISDETLMAYADGEADAATRSSVESAMQVDPQIAQRIARHRAMRQAMQGAFASVLEEPVPERLVAAARGPATPATNRKAQGNRAWRWQPFAMAASLLLGVGVGYLAWHEHGPLIEAGSGGLFAGAALTDALSGQLAEDHRAGSPVEMGLSFRSKTGGYCRTFSLSGAAASTGLACRDGARWNIKALAPSAGGADGANFRMAASALPPAVRAAVEDSIDGEPLDRAAEIAARQAGWASAAR
jgi:hypothetical protein